MTADSDVDILIVKQVDNLHELARQARRSLPDDHPPVDIVPATRQLLERRREWLSQVYRPAVAEGIVTYENNRTIEYGTRRASDTLPQRDESETERMVRIFHYRREEAVEFLKKAQTDLSVVNSTDRTIEPEARCYSAQAATEKALKALLVAHECTVPGRHELGKVVEEIKKTGEALPEIATDERLKKLSEYAGPAQYPGLERDDNRGGRERVLRDRANGLRARAQANIRQRPRITRRHPPYCPFDTRSNDSRTSSRRTSMSTSSSFLM